MLISQFTRRQLRHADEYETEGGGYDRTTSISGGLLAAFCGKFIIIIDGTLFKTGARLAPQGQLRGRSLLGL